uniref:Photosynthesis system II assembly factor Ycf48/Hcf136-like domain-containing protein n=1 Tax=Fagus sylvatica TaxID=28930 RepID=A0A2N9ETV5_FAGSY
MANLLQVNECTKPVMLLSFSINTGPCPRPRQQLRTRKSPPQASLQQSSRRQFVSQTTSLSLSLLVGASPLIASSEEALSEWERVYLPIDPGVVLLDIAFVPDDSNHGFVLGTRQTILETKDGGTNWLPRSIPSAEDEDFNYRFNSISFKGNEGWIVGKPAILLYTSDAGQSWDRIPLSSQLPGDMKWSLTKAPYMLRQTGATTGGLRFRKLFQLLLIVSSGISGASYYTGTFNAVNRSPDGRYVAVSSRGNFYLTWEPGQGRRSVQHPRGGFDTMLQSNGSNSISKDALRDEDCP